MKKRIVFLMCLCFVGMSAMAAAPTCEDHGGSIITANNGTKFCKSDKAMNWWSAFAWCESQNRTLAEFSKMCPDTQQYPTETTGDCPNLQELDDDVWVWSSLAWSSQSALLVNLSSGAVSRRGRTDSYGYHHALCE